MGEQVFPWEKVRGDLYISSSDQCIVIRCVSLPKGPHIACYSCLMDSGWMLSRLTCQLGQCLRLCVFHSRLSFTVSNLFFFFLCWDAQFVNLTVDVSPSVRDAKLEKLALRIFLISCMKLGDHKGRKVTEPDFSKKFSLCPKRAICAQNGLFSNLFEIFSETALTIFQLFCTKLGDNMAFQLVQSAILGKCSFGPKTGYSPCAQCAHFRRFQDYIQIGPSVFFRFCVRTCGPIRPFNWH